MGLTTLFALRRPLDVYLRGYLAATALHSALQGILLLVVPVTSYLYGFEWYAGRIFQLVFALLYACDISSFRRRIIVGGFVSVVFSFNQLPNIWFNWLAFGYSFLLLSLGLSLVEESPIIGLYWIAMGAWQYAFFHLSMRPDSLVWQLNSWLPSAISIAAFLSISLSGTPQFRLPVRPCRT